ncbi:hypothetical protein LRP50_04180 [Enterovibrio sp. ZSDZ42]|uniref:Uncharacterized protein n=1 Tax=Enterovibrio gelatinilyticus TaxID=2899819 RepID=A0ABT5QWB7_9GAMM|nr:hypothetical protein [Enterovibrio sp. ZSDZ42]MDD1792322.1 hypothetical protein [Enterovibrio sp. ZSDZ42]
MAIAGSASAEIVGGDGFISRVDEIEVNQTAIGSRMQLLRVEEITFSDATICGDQTIAVNNDSLEIENVDDYHSAIRNVWYDAAEGGYFLVTTNGCESKGTEMITSISLCSLDICDEKYVIKSDKVWLDSDYLKVRKLQASMYMEKTLPYDESSKSYKVKGVYIESDSVAFESSILDESQLGLSFYGAYTGYYPNGEFKEKYTYDVDGRKQGKGEEFHENGKIKRSASFNDDQLHGEVFSYHGNGQIQSKLLYELGELKDGKYTHYSEDGSVFTSYEKRNGSYVGTQKYFYSNGVLANEKVYENGEIVLNVSFDKSGAKSSESTVDGALTTVNFYKASGFLRQREIFKNTGNSEVMILRESWYDNGNKKYVANYNENLRMHGEQKEWYENGKLSSIYGYSSGEKISSKEWSKNGFLIEESYFKGYKEDKNHKKWDANTGRLIYEVEYDNGMVISAEKTYDGETGSLIKEQYPSDDGSFPRYNFFNGEPPIKYYENGELVKIVCGYSTSIENPVVVFQSAENEDVDSQLMLADFYRGCGEGQRSISWYERAAKNNNLEAARSLVYIYKYGEEHYQQKPDANMALKYVLQSAELDEDGFNLYIAGVEYLPDDFVKEILPSYDSYTKVDTDFVTAKENLIASSEKGFTSAKYVLGLMFQHGVGVDKSKASALSYFEDIRSDDEKLADRLISGIN